MHATSSVPSLLRANLRTAVAGVLMGVANLIPGVSGGTMILAVGLYGEFIDSVAEITALRFSVRRVAFLGVLGVFAAVTIKGLAGVVLYLLFHHAIAMYSLFIGMTLGGVPLLMRSLQRREGTKARRHGGTKGGRDEGVECAKRSDVGAGLAVAAGVLLMILIALGRQYASVPQNTVVDVVAGVVAATTMVLPGISGSYMLLIMGQYDRVVGAVDRLDFSIIVPVSVGAVAGIVGLSNVLKYLLHHYQRVTLGFLLGMLLGSVIGLWPFGRTPSQETLTNHSLEELRQLADDRGLDGKGTEARRHGGTEGRGQGTEGRGQGTEARRHEGTEGEGRGSDYTVLNIAMAAGMAVMGFFITFALSKQGESLNPSPDRRRRVSA